MSNAINPDPTVSRDPRTQKIQNDVDATLGVMQRVVSQHARETKDTVESLISSEGGQFHRATSSTDIFKKFSTKKQTLGTWFSDLNGLEQFLFIVASIFSLGIVPAAVAYYFSKTSKSDGLQQS